MNYDTQGSGPHCSTVTVEKFDNQLTLITAPATTPGVSTVAVHVGVGFRAEPEEFAGMAHLFEHLMFQGSARFDPGEHFRRIEGFGGQVGGHTRHDYTEFFNVVPADALVETVQLEADRLAGPRLDQATLETQVNVIRAEIAQQITAVPHGGFPWLHLPAAMYTQHVNTHDGYGDVGQLSRVDLNACQQFFDDWYAPQRVVVTIEGDLGTLSDQERIRELLGAIEAHPSPAPDVVIDEPALTSDHHLTLTARNAPEPVWAMGFRLPDPTTHPRLYAACSALSLLLPAHAPQLRLGARCGWYSVPLDAHSPDAWVLTTYPRDGVTPEQLSEAMRELISEWTDDAPTPAVLTHAHHRARHANYQRAQRPGHRARRLGAAQLLFQDSSLDYQVDPSFAVNPGILNEAAHFLLDQSVGSVLLRPETSR